MRNNELYKELKTATDGYTVAQANALTDSQIRTLAKIDTATGTFIKNMQAELVAELQRVQNEADEQQIKETLDTGFPGWKTTVKGKEINDRFTAIEVIK